MKKIIRCCLFLLITIALFGCVTTEKKVSKISYYVEGSVNITLSPNTYEEGKGLVLPIPNLKSYEIFDGWYEDRTYKGDKVTKITKEDTGDKVYYGRILSKLNADIDFNKNNYRYTISSKSNGEVTSTTYSYNQGDIAVEIANETQYLAKVNNQYRYIFKQNNSWYYIPETTEGFEYYIAYFEILKLNSLSNEKFNLNEAGYYEPQEENLQTVCKAFVGDYEDEVFSECKVYVESNLITKVTLKSIYTYNNESHDYEHEVTISDYDKASFNIPSAKLYEDESKTTIGDVYKLADGTTDVTVSGVITGIYGNNFYISDGQNGLLVYCGNNTSFASQIILGNTVTVTGTVQIYKTIHQLSNIENVETSSDEYQLNEIVLTSLSQDNLKNYISQPVNVYNATIKTLPTSYPTTDSDVSFKIAVNNVEAIVFISKHLDQASKEKIFSILKNATVGDTIDLTGLHVSYYNQYQLAITNAANIEDSYHQGDPVVIKYLSVEPSQLIIACGTQLDDALKENKVKVIATYNNKDTKQLAYGEYQVSGSIDTNTVGSYTITISYNGVKTTLTVVVNAAARDTFKANVDHCLLEDVLDKMGYDEETGEILGITKGLPSIGNPNVLVIPVEFTDCKAPSSMVEDLKTAFFGTSEQTGWESLSSYYQKSSYGKLNIKGDVMKPFNTGKTVGYYEQLQKEFNKALENYTKGLTDVYPDNVEYSIIKEALAYYDGEIDYSKYDTNNDGYIDSIYLVYTTDYNAEDSDSLWWAFTTEYFSSEEQKYDNVEADFYIFMSYRFLFDELQGKTVKYNAETIIHETGHLLGLNDYYDYDDTTGPSGGIGGGDMMDCNVGDHNAYSKLMLGWVSPTVVSGKTTTITLDSFATSGDCVVISKGWNGTFFDEYYIIDFYTPTGLNEFGAGNSGLFSTSGIRIYHVDSKLKDPKDCFSILDITLYDNSYTDHRQIKLIEADGRNDVDIKGYSENSDLFQKGSTYKNSIWYDGTSTGFTITVDQITSTSATITITY